MNQYSKTPGLAIVGFGGMGSQHAKMLGSVSDVFRLAGIYDIREERQQYAAKLGLSPFASYEELLASPDVDVVLIATPNHLHRPLSIQALQAGKHVICKKPAMLNAEELEDVLAVARKSGRVFVVHQNRRWDDDFRAVKQVLKGNSLGKVFTIESRIMGSQGIPGDWRTKREFGGGMLLDWGIHLTDQLLWMVPGRLNRIYCKLGHILGGECDDSVKLFLSFENGIEALVEVATWNMEALPRWYVAGMGGTLTIRDLWCSESRLTRLKQTGGATVRPVDAGKGITKTLAPRDPATLEIGEVSLTAYDVCDFYRNVATAIRGEANLIVAPEESLRVMRVMDAARRSAELDVVIHFEE